MEQRTIRPRIADVAREAGVSKTAVSFAFNCPERLSTETASRMLTQRETLTIGVLTPQAPSVVFSNPFFGAFTEGVAVAAEESGYALHFISPLGGSLAGALSRATVDGVVAIGLSDEHPEVEAIRGAGVPGDVSVVGLDDIDLSSHVEPPLTTVHQPIRQKGEEAVRLLLVLVGKTGGAAADHRLLETRLVVRGSSGPVPPPR